MQIYDFYDFAVLISAVPESQLITKKRISLTVDLHGGIILDHHRSAARLRFTGNGLCRHNFEISPLDVAQVTTQQNNTNTG